MRHAWTIWVAIALQKFGWTGLWICSCCVPTYLGGLWLGDEVCTTSSISWWFLMILDDSSRFLMVFSMTLMSVDSRVLHSFFGLKATDLDDLFGCPKIGRLLHQTCVFWARWGGKHVKTRSAKSNKNWYSWRIFAIKGGGQNLTYTGEMQPVDHNSSPNFWLSSWWNLKPPNPQLHFEGGHSQPWTWQATPPHPADGRNGSAVSYGYFKFKLGEHFSNMSEMSVRKTWFYFADSKPCSVHFGGLDMSWQAFNMS